MGHSGVYVSLSHCWIDRTVLTTTKSTLASRQTNIPSSTLPPLFRDAVKVCRFLGVQYLWIDSLCIIQGDQDDWEEQAASMDSIYENCFFTIAVHDDDSIRGFIPRQISHQVRSETNSQAAIYVREVTTPHFLKHNSSSFWDLRRQPNWIHARGWCYQERLLSRRILHFVKDEVIFESEGEIRCQCGSHYMLANNQLQGPIHLGWKEIVEHYTQLSFTESWDLLPGLAGIARRYQSLCELGDYFAGLWTTDLARWLCWESVQRFSKWEQRRIHMGCECAPRSKRLPPPPSKHYSISSFTWASRLGPCEFIRDAWTGAYDQTVRIIETKCIVDQRNPFGRVNHCSIRLEAKTSHCYVYSTAGKGAPYASGCDGEHAYVCDQNLHDEVRRESIKPSSDSWFTKTVKENGVRLHLDAWDDIPSDGTKLLALELFHSTGRSLALILRKKSTFSSAYRRIGIGFFKPGYFPGNYKSITLH
jgi:hypothetical protein